MAMFMQLVFTRGLLQHLLMRFSRNKCTSILDDTNLFLFLPLAPIANATLCSHDIIVSQHL
jgi:hypothetical protein